MQLETLIETDNREAIFNLLTSSPQLADVETSHGMSPVLLACYYRKPEIAATIANFSNHITLFDLCALGNLKATIRFLDQFPNAVHRFSKDGFTPLGMAAYFGHEEIVRLLIQKGADVNVPANNGFQVYPLHSAVSGKNYRISKILIDAGADVNVQQKAGFTPLHAAAQLGDIELIVLLLEYDAAIDATMEDGKRPADLAKEKGFMEIAEILA